jgi:hypothetical protein
VISVSVSGCSTGLLRVLSGSAPSGFNPECFFGDMKATFSAIYPERPIVIFGCQ